MRLLISTTAAIGPSGLALLTMMAIAAPANAEDADPIAPRLAQLEQRLDQITSDVETLSDRLSDTVTKLGALTDELAKQQADSENNVAAAKPQPAPQTRIVAITQNPDPIISHLFEQLEAQHDALPIAGSRLSSARDRYRELREQGSTDINLITEARQEMIGLDYKVRKIKSRIRRIGLQIEHARNHRTIMGMAGDGSVVNIEITNDVRDLANTLTEGSTYRITGSTIQRDGVIDMKMTSAEPSNLHLPVSDVATE